MNTTITLVGFICLLLTVFEILILLLGLPLLFLVKLVKFLK